MPLPDYSDASAGWRPMTDDEKREALEILIAGAVNHAIGNNMPDMSGDPRKRLRPHWLRTVQDAAKRAVEIMREEEEG